LLEALKRSAISYLLDTGKVHIPQARPDRLWGPPSLLSNGSQGHFSWRQSGRDVKLTTHLHLMRRSKNAWSYNSIPQHAFMAWCSVLKKAQGQLYIYL